MPDFDLFPESASTLSGQIDLLYFALVALSVIFASGVFAALIFFAIRYRRGANVDRSNPLIEDSRLEITWTVIPLILGLAIFVWNAVVFFESRRAPEDTLEISVVGKQWMWKLQHPNGKSEINELHVPVDQPVKLTMISQDVIHSFYVPAFRMKQDVLPGRYTTTWFEATETGEYHLFCTEYCGTEHSLMIGQVVVMEPVQYQEWLSGGTGNEPLDVTGGRLFQQLGCESCHRVNNEGRGPSLVGVYGSEVELTAGGTITADDAYLRESILTPNAHVVAGFEPVMPTYQGQLSEEEIVQLIAYIKSLSSGQPAAQSEN
jgi:cytochrome c oxidase subunit 2